MKGSTASRIIQKRIEELNKKLDENEYSIKESGGLPFWRGKKIISVKQWQSIANKRGYEKAIKCIPNSFIDYSSLALSLENGNGHRDKDEQYNKWINDYSDYLHYSKNPKLGESYCEKCLLEDDNDQEIHSGLGLRKILRELRQQELSSGDVGITATYSSSPSSCGSSNSTSSARKHIDNSNQRRRTVSVPNKQKKEKEDAKTIRKQKQHQPLTMINYPCPVHDRFKCPYYESSEIDDSDLVSDGKCIELTYNALSYAHMLTYQIRDYTYKVDFEKNKHVETINKYGCGSSKASSKRPGVELSSLKQPKVPIESIHDIYKALTDRETLDIILDQYLEHRRRNPLDYGDYPNFDYIQRKESYDTLRHLLLDWFMQIKDDITIKDFTNFNGLTLQEEEEDIKRRSLDQSTTVFVDHSNDICCECNKRWACILCINCDKWICTDHWMKHGEVRHHLEIQE